MKSRSVMAGRMGGKTATDSGDRGLAGIARDLRAYLTQERDEGAAEISLGGNARAWVKDRSVRRRTSVPKAAPGGPSGGGFRAGQGPGDSLESVAAEVSKCRKCHLHSTRTRTVPGQGNPSPEIMFVGEGPGEDEDRQGLAFVGKAGQLLTKMISAMGLSREEVFIGNIVKCRPPGNRAPVPEEMDACMPYLKRQIAILKPKVIVALGGTAVKGLMNVTDGITKLRGRWMDLEGIAVMPTYHPAYLLRSPNMKHDAWADLKEVLRRLGRTPPKP